jgi:hypothetical protein
MSAPVQNENYSSSSEEEDRFRSKRRSNKENDDSSSSSSEDELDYIRQRRREKDLQDKSEGKRGTKRGRDTFDKEESYGYHPPATNEAYYGEGEAPYGYPAPYYSPRRPPRGGGYRGRGARGMVPPWKGGSMPIPRGRGRGRVTRGFAPQRGAFERGSKRRMHYSYQNESYMEREEEVKESEYDSMTRDLLMSIGDEGIRSHEKHITKLSQEFIDDISKDGEDTIITSLLLDSILKMPTKIPIYGALVGLINLQQPEFTKLFLIRLSETFKSNVNCCNWRECKILLSFICELANAGIITAANIFESYKPFIDEINKESKGVYCNSMKDTFVYIVLASLPYGIEKLQEEDTSQFTDILNTIGRYMYKRAKIMTKYSNVEPCQLFYCKNNTKTSISDNLEEYKMDYLQYMWYQFSGKFYLEFDEDEIEEDNEQCDGYEEEQSFSLPTINTILTPYKLFEEKLSQQSEKLELKIEFNKPAHIYTKVFKGHLGLFEPVILADYEFNSTMKITKSHLPSNIDRLILGEYISDFLHMNYLNSHLQNIQRVQSLLFQLIIQSLESNKQNTEDNISSEDEKSRKEKALIIVKYMIVDSILGHMFILPLPPIRMQYYRTLISDFITSADVKEDEIQNRKIVDSYINKCFELIPEMDTECVINRFAIFFAHYLYQNNLEWDWESWKKYLIVTNEATKSSVHMRQDFVRQVLYYLYRLSSLETVYQCITPKIANSIDNASETMSQYIDSESKPYSYLQVLVPVESTPYYKYGEKSDSDEPVQYLKQAQAILNAIQSNQKPVHITSMINEYLESGISRAIAMEILMHSLLHCSKSLSQLDYYLKEYSQTIISIMEDKGDMMDSEVKRQKIEMQCIIAKSIWQYWKNSPQFCIITLQKLLMFKRSILSLQSIVSFIFQNIDDQNIKQSSLLLNKYSYVWEVLRSSLEAVLTRCVSSKERGDESLFKSSVEEIQEAVLFLIQKFAHTLLVRSDTDEESVWRYQRIWSHFKEMVRCWQRFIPQYFQSFTKFIMDKYKVNMTSPQLSLLSSFFKHCEYYESLQTSGGIEMNVDTTMDIVQCIGQEKASLSEIIEQMKEDTYVCNNLHQSEFTI